MVNCSSFSQLNLIHYHLIVQYHPKNLYFYLSMIILCCFATIQESYLSLPHKVTHLVTLLNHLLLSSFQMKLKIMPHSFMLKFGCFQRMFGYWRSELIE